jgi:hypothetical protein
MARRFRGDDEIADADVDDTVDEIVVAAGMVSPWRLFMFCFPVRAHPAPIAPAHELPVSLSMKFVR